MFFFFNVCLDITLLAIQPLCKFSLNHHHPLERPALKIWNGKHREKRIWTDSFPDVGSGTRIARAL